MDIFLLQSANPVPRGQFYFLYPPMSDRGFGTGGVYVYVNHSREGGAKGSQKELGSESYSTRQTAALCENHFSPHPHPTSTGVQRTTSKTRQHFYINVPMD